MDQKHARYVFLGLVIGTAMGILFGVASGNAVLGMGVGALGGVFVGWFVGSAMQRWQREKNPEGQAPRGHRLERTARFPGVSRGRARARRRSPWPPHER